METALTLVHEREGGFVMVAQGLEPRTSGM
jgi:hypothetical protein